MRNLIVCLLTFTGLAAAQCGANGSAVINPLTGKLDCTGKVGGAAYSASFTAQTTITVTAATHAQGLTPTGVCYDNGTPRATIALTAGYPQVAANGDITFAWTGSKTGLCLISALGSAQGPKGADGTNGAPGANGSNGSPGANGTNGAGFVGRGTFAQMSAASPSVRDVWQLTDAANPGNCGAGSGTYTADCTWNGSVWVSSTGFDPTKTGAVLWSGVTSGGLAFAVSDVAGSLVTVVLPSDTSTATAGYVLALGSLTTCPGGLPSWAPQTCRASSWAAGGSNGTSVQVNTSTVSTPNFNSSTPSADAGYTALPFKVSGSNVLVQMPITFANGANSCQYWVAPPADWNATGATGQCAIDATYKYAYAGGRWQRVAWDSGWGTNTVSIPTHTPDTGTYNDVTSVTVADSTPSAHTCTTTDGTTPTTPGTPNNTCTNGTLDIGTVSVTADGTVIKSLGTKTGSANSAVRTSTYSLVVLTPTDSPGAGTYTSTQSVTLTSGTSSPYICYTTDGSTPAGDYTGCTTGTHYTGAITVASSLTIKAIAYKASFTASGVLTSAYVINAPAAPSVTSNYKIQTVSPSGGTFTLGGINASTGNRLWAFIGIQAGSSDCSTPNPGNVLTIGGSVANANWHLIGTRVDIPYTCGYQYYTDTLTGNISNGTITVTMTVAYSGAQMGYAEIANSSSGAVANCSGTATTGTFVQCSSALSPSGNALIITGAETYYNVTGWTGANGFTVPASNGTVSGGSGSAAIAWQQTSSSVTPKLTFTGTANHVILGATFQ